MPIRKELKTEEKKENAKIASPVVKKFNNIEKCIKKALTTIAYSLEEEECS